MAQPYRFKVHALLKDLIGKDLINDDNIAIVELVKNSIDAAAKTIQIRFRRTNAALDVAPDRLIVLDNGTGMDVADLEDKWLNIAYSDKKETSKRTGVLLAGNKGIGRFSCDRLGATLDLVTRRRDGATLHMRISWIEFEQRGDKDFHIQRVPIAIEEIDQVKAREIVGFIKLPLSFTAIVIGELRSSWDRDALKGLRQSLERFSNPNQLFELGSVQIKLEVPWLLAEDALVDESSRINGLVRNQIFKNLEFKATYLEAKASAGVLSWKLFHESETVFELDERNVRFPLLDDIELVIYYLNPYKKAYFKRQTGMRSVDFGSIFLFLNGFRVAPYGDRGDDWLGLDIRKSQGTTRYLGSRDVVGRIQIRGSEDDFKPVSSREGLKRTPALDQLRDGFFLSALRKLERFVVDCLDWDSVPQRLRDELRSEAGLDWLRTKEVYAESWEKKQQRIAIQLMSVVGASPASAIRFKISPAILETLTKEREGETTGLIEQLNAFDGDKLDAGVRESLGRVSQLLHARTEDAREARASANRLQVKVHVQEAKIADLATETEAYRAQTLFLASVSSLDAKRLLEFHHQIGLDVDTLKNNLTKAIRRLRSSNAKLETTEALGFLEKAWYMAERIASTSRYATKANFRADSRKEVTDIPAFFEQYINEVARDYSAASLRVVVDNQVNEPFDVKASRLELAILIDNLFHNATRAHAQSVSVTMRLMSPNRVAMSFVDNGDGFSTSLQDINSVFEQGLSTTSGSGLGLSHVRRIAEAMGGSVLAGRNDSRGATFTIEVTR